MSRIDAEVRVRDYYYDYTTWDEATGKYLPTHPINAVVLFDVGGSLGYEWESEMLILRLTDGRLFRYKDCGCSCNGPFDGINVWSDLELVPHHANDLSREVSHDFARRVGPWIRSSVAERKLAAELIGGGLTDAQALEQARIAHE